MLSQPLEGALRFTGASFLTDLMIIALVVVFVSAIYLKKKNRAHSYTQYVPTLLTTLGILGTFAGIIVGLLGFDAKDIDGSIELLLGGLKTAFITSLLGMFLSISYKLALAGGWLAPTESPDEIDEDQIGIADLYAAMRAQADGTEALRAAIGGDGDNSLVSQMKLMRSEHNDQQKLSYSLQVKSIDNLLQINETAKSQTQSFAEFQERLWIKLQDFADMMSKSATEQVINALKEVISDFNNNLIEQFGENFKQLNAAVLELVQWQDNYKVQLGQMTDQYALGISAISQTEQAVSHISEESKVIPASMQELKSVMEVNQHQLQELQRHLEAFKDIRDRAVEALPEIRTQIDTTVEGMKQATETMVSGMEKATVQVVEGIKGSGEALSVSITSTAEELVENSKRVHESLQGTSDLMMTNGERSKVLFEDFISDSSGYLRNLMDEMQNGTGQIKSTFEDASATLIKEIESMRGGFEVGLTDMRTKLGASMHDMTEQHMKENQKVLKGMSQHADDALKDTGEALKKQVNALNDSMNHQLTSVMTEFGRALTTITGKFTQDYQKLVSAMNDVMRTRGDR